MIGLSVKGKYGLLALYELATHFHKGPIQIKLIAETHNIPQNYLEQLLVDLKKAELVRSYRGNQGGYELAKLPDSITILEALTCLEGPLQLSQNSSSACLDFFWEDVESAIRISMSLTLADLISQKQRLDRMLTFSI